VRYPLGRKQYNGRVERSHRTDDEEFYRPYLLDPLSTDLLLSFDSEGGNDLLAQIGKYTLPIGLNYAIIQPTQGRAAACSVQRALLP